jgi:molybdopterin synthase sulfur carrier subunit
MKGKKVKFKFFAMLQEAGREVEVEFKGSTLRDAFEALFSVYPALRERIMENDRIKDFYKVFVNGRDIHHLKNLETEINDGDIIAVFPPVAGGRYCRFV